MALPTTIVAGDSGHVSHHVAIHKEINGFAAERGEWNVATAYDSYDEVLRDGQAYLALTPTTGTDPIGHPATWALLSPSHSVTYWAGLPEALISGAISRDANNAITTAAVTWPDGATGTFTTTTASTSFPGAVDAYTITHVFGGVTTTYTQSAVTRNSLGIVTTRPAITHT